MAKTLLNGQRPLILSILEMRENTNKNRFPYVKPKCYSLSIEEELLSASVNGSYYHYAGNGEPIYSDSLGYYNPITGEYYSQEWIEENYPQESSFWEGSWGE